MPSGAEAARPRLGQVAGLGPFGAVKVLLRTPLFGVTQLPFQDRELVRF